MGSTGHYIGSDWNWRGNVKEYVDKYNTQTSGPVLYRVLDSATKGGVYYAALERTSVGSGQRDVFALVEPYRLYGKGYNRELIVKDQDETMGPIDIDCPAKVLKKLTEPLNDSADAWRRKCWAKIEADKQKTTPQVGDTLVFEEPFTFGAYGEADTFEVLSWGRRKRFVALGEKTTFRCRLTRWALDREYIVIPAA